MSGDPNNQNAIFREHERALRMGMAGVNLYATESPYEIRSLRDRLMKEKHQMVEALMAASDWSNFQYRKGQIDSLTLAITMLEDLTREKD